MTFTKEDFLSPEDYENAQNLIHTLSKINLEEYTLNHVHDGILKEPSFVFGDKKFLLRSKDFSVILIGSTCTETGKIQFTKEMLFSFFKEYTLVKTFNIQDLI